MASKKKYLRGYVHRVVMETILGRKLGFDETVHHKNGDVHDNRPENLCVLSRSDHGKLHSPQVHAIWRTCTNCGKRYKPHRSARGKQKTCSRKCGYAIMGQSRHDSATNLSTASQVIALREQGMSYRKIAKELNISQASAWRCCNKDES